MGVLAKLFGDTTGAVDRTDAQDLLRSGVTAWKAAGLALVHSRGKKGTLA